MIVARICGSCGEFIRGSEPCTECSVRKLEGKWSSVQFGAIDGPTLCAVDEPSWPVDPKDPHKRRIVPNKRAWKDRIARSEGKIEDLSG